MTGVCPLRPAFGDAPGPPPAAGAGRPGVVCPRSTRAPGERAGAEALVAAFGRNELDAYFACSSEDATFTSHATDRLLTPTAEYRRLRDEWVREDGLRIVDCSTSGTTVQDRGGWAVLTHT